MKLRAWVIYVIAASWVAASLIFIVIIDYEHQNVPLNAASLIVGAPTVLIGVVGIALQLAAADGSGQPLDELSKIAEDLAKAVGDQWTEEAGLRGFRQDAHSLRVSWKPAAEGFESWDHVMTTALRENRGPDGAPEDPATWAATSAGLAGSDQREIREVFNRVPTRRLVVLGDPGAGKTQLLIQLLQDLLANRGPGDAVPVIVSLASWCPEDEDLHTWLRGRLAIDYPNLRALVAGQKITRGRYLLDNHMLLPILDGLDELPQESRWVAIFRINEVLKEHPRGIVLACRRTDYLDAARPRATRKDEPARPPVSLRAAVGIVLQPLAPADVADYLQRGAQDDEVAARRWDPVVARLGSDCPLGKTLTTPLTVTLAHAIYDPGWRGWSGLEMKPAELLDFSDEQTILEHLFKSFIQAAYRPGGTQEKGPITPVRQAQRWLSFLAREDGLAWWQLRTPRPGLARAGHYRAVCGIAAAIPGTTGTHAGVGIGMGLGVGVSLSAWYSAFRSAGCARGPPVRPVIRGRPGNHGRLRGWSRRRPGRRPGRELAGLGHTASPISGLPAALGVGLGVGACTTFTGALVGGAFGGFAAGVLEGVGKGLSAGIVNGLGIALVVAVIVRYVGRATPAAKRQWSWRIGVGGGVLVGGAVGVIAGFKENAWIGLILGAALGAAAAWPIGLMGTKFDAKAIAAPGAALSRDARAFWTTALASRRRSRCLRIRRRRACLHLRSARQVYLPAAGLGRSRMVSGLACHPG